MNALVAIRTLGGELRTLTAAKRAQSKQALAAQQSAEKSLSTTAAKSSAAKASETKATETDSEDGVSRTVKKELDKDAFLQLLVFQLQNQDPMSPTDNTQMIAQLAQFSSLEQMNKLNTSFDTLSSNVDRLNFVSASSLVGKTVAGKDSEGTLTEGKVERVYLDTESNSIYVLVGETPIELSNLVRIDGTAA